MACEIEETLRKKAFGFFVDDVVEHGGKERKLKYVPPDLEALKLLESRNRSDSYEFLSTNELIEELEKAIAELKESI